MLKRNTLMVSSMTRESNAYIFVHTLSIHSCKYFGHTVSPSNEPQAFSDTNFSLHVTHDYLKLQVEAFIPNHQQIPATLCNIKQF